MELEEDALDDYEEPETNEVAKETTRVEETDSARTSAAMDEARASTEDDNPEKPV